MPEPMPEPTPDGVRADKEQLRRALRARLASLDPVADQLTAQRLGEMLLAQPEIEAARRVFLCLSFGVEVDTWNLADRLLATGRQVIVPRAIWRTRRMTVHRFPCRFETLRFGLRQPAATEPLIDPASIDVACVAGLAFDRRGFRLGHGAGFFDRFLVDRRFPSLGLVRDCQVLDAVPVEPHDLPMTAVVSDQARYD